MDGEVLTFGLWLGRVVDARKQRGRIFQPDGLLVLIGRRKIFLLLLYFFSDKLD
jgi:hypothetical protein